MKVTAIAVYITVFLVAMLENIQSGFAEIPIDQLHQSFDEAGKEFSVPSNLLRAIAVVESNWDQGAKSNDGGWGIMQLTENVNTHTLTHAAKLLNVSADLFKENSLRGAIANIRGGAAVLQKYSFSAPGIGQKLIFDDEPRQALETWWFVVTTYNGGGADGRLETSNYPFRVYNLFLRGVHDKVSQIDISFPPNITSEPGPSSEVNRTDSELFPKTPPGYIRVTPAFNANNLVLHDNSGSVIKSPIQIVNVSNQPAGVELSPTGISRISWMFETPQVDWVNTKSQGKDGHEGDDFYADDWARAASGGQNGEQRTFGQTVYAGISGIAIVKPNHGGYGNDLIIYDPKSKFALRNAHLSEILVEDGQLVVAGCPVAKVGKTGGTKKFPITGSHLHIVLYKNVQNLNDRPIINPIIEGVATEFAAPFLYNPRVNCTPTDKSLVRAKEDIKVFWLQNNILYHVLNPQIAEQMSKSGLPGWTWPNVHVFPPDILNTYKIGPKFIAANVDSNGLLIRQTKDIKVYLIENGKRRWIENEKIFRERGYNFDDVIEVLESIIKLLPEGDVIGAGTQPPAQPFTPPSSPPSASSPITLSVEPKSRTIILNSTFTISIIAKESTNLAGYELDLTFNPAVLEAISVTEGDFLKSDGGSTNFLLPKLDNSVGLISGVANARTSLGGIKGSGTLVTVNFKAKGKGDSPVTFQKVLLSEPSAKSIPYLPPENGAVTVITCPPWDVNCDGIVNVLDLVIVGQNFRKINFEPRADVNQDGAVNVLDLVLVGQHFRETTIIAAPAITLENLNSEQIAVLERMYRIMDNLPNTEPGFAHTKMLLQELILLAPKQVTHSRVLQNYPNPFNPETWIPYELAEPTTVTITIYDASGRSVKTLNLGYKSQGAYISKETAAYWNGRNEIGEEVTSGIYYYGIQAGKFADVKKMILIK